jgi:hypothetical protein
MNTKKISDEFIIVFEERLNRMNPYYRKLDEWLNMNDVLDKDACEMLHDMTEEEKIISEARAKLQFLIDDIDAYYMKRMIKK